MTEHTDMDLKESTPIKKVNIKSVIIELAIYAILFFVCIFIIPKYVLQRTVVNGDSKIGRASCRERVLRLV